MKLLSTGNPKLMKGEKQGYLSFVLHLAPSWLSGYNVCAMASKGCIRVCLNLAGRGGIFKKGETTNVIQKARIAKTVMFFEEREAFMTQLVREVKAAIRQAEKKNMIPCFRLNGTSDIRWETVEVGGHRNIMEMFPQVQFYDYTKLPNRKNLPSNYHLTFSRSEENDHLLPTVEQNIAVVFDVLPGVYLGRPVISGDDTDLRFLDPQGVVVGLKAKGKAKKDTSGFTVITKEA